MEHDMPYYDIVLYMYNCKIYSKLSQSEMCSEHNFTDLLQKSASETIL